MHERTGAVGEHGWRIFKLCNELRVIQKRGFDYFCHAAPVLAVWKTQHKLRADMDFLRGKKRADHVLVA